MDVEDDPEIFNTSSLRSNEDNHSAEGSPKDVVPPEAVSIVGGSTEESIAEGANRDQNHYNEQADPDGGIFDSSDSSSQDKIAAIGQHSSEDDRRPPLGQIATEVANLESESIETKMNEDNKNE